MTAAVTVPPLPVAQHRLDLYEEGTLTGATVVCLGDAGAECRWWCSEPGADCETCGPAGDHAWGPVPYCRIAEWINAVGVEDTCADEDRLRFDVDGDSQSGIRSGLIETEWTGDDYVWTYPEPEPAP